MPPTSVPGSGDSFYTANETWGEVRDGVGAFTERTGVSIAASDVGVFEDIYIEERRGMGRGFDGSRGFVPAFLGFIGGVNQTPRNLEALKAAWRSDVTQHVFDYVQVPPDEQNQLNLIWQYTEFASIFMRNGNFELAAQAYRVVAVVTDSRFSDYLPILQNILNLANSNLSRFQQLGERLLASISFDNEADILNSPTLLTLIYQGPLTSEYLASWNELLNAKIGENIRIPEVDPSFVNRYAQQATGQFHGLVDSLSESAGEPEANSAANSLQILLNRGETGLVRNFLAALNKVERTPLRDSVYALIHITAARVGLSPERIALTESILRLALSVSPVLPLAVVYLADLREDASVDANLVTLLGTMFNLQFFVTEEEMARRIERFNPGAGQSIAYTFETLAYHFFNNLVHHWDVSNSDAARLLESVGTQMLGRARIALMSQVLYQDMLRGTEHFDRMKPEKYMEILLDADPEVQRLIDNANVEGREWRSDLFAEYEKIKSGRGGGGGGESGSAPSGMPFDPAGSGGASYLSSSYYSGYGTEMSSADLEMQNVDAQGQQSDNYAVDVFAGAQWGSAAPVAGAIYFTKWQAEGVVRAALVH